MPPAASSSLANKARDSLKLAEKYWERAKNTPQAQRADNKYAYAMGVVKNCLGLESADLVMCGGPLDLIIESGGDGEAQASPFERFFYSVGLSELCLAEVQGKSTAIAYIDEKGCSRIRRSFLFNLGQVISEGFDREYLMQMFPNVNPEYLVHICDKGEKT